MPVFSYFAIVGAVLVALFFLADATLEKGASPVVTSERVGLPKSWHPDPVQTPTPNLIPTPEMTSLAVISNQPVSEAEGHAINPAALAARAEASPKKEKRVTRQAIKRPQNHVQQNHVQHSSLFDRFSIRDQ